MALLETQVANVFVHVARGGSFSKAASELGTTQSAVSARIKQLEDAVGRLLLRRHSRGVELTDAGKSYLVYCEELIRVAEAAQRFVVSGGDARTELRIGMFHTLSTYLMPDLISEFMKANRGVRLQVKVGSTEEMRAHLGNGAIDCALIAAVGVDAMMTVHAKLKDEMGWLIKPKVLKGSDDLLGKLCVLPIYCVRRGDLYEASIRQLFQDGGVAAAMPVFLELGSREILRSMLLTGMGFTFISRGVFRNEIERGVFDFHPVPAQLPRLHPAFVSIAGRAKSDVVQSFIRHFVRTVGK